MFLPSTFEIGCKITRPTITLMSEKLKVKSAANTLLLTFNSSLLVFLESFYTDNSENWRVDVRFSIDRMPKFFDLPLRTICNLPLGY